jgi:hypothetical protein
VRHGRPLLASLVAAACAAAIAGAADAGQHAPAALLPDLMQETPGSLQVKTIRTRGGPRFRLGFSAAVFNAGTGPLILDARRPGRRQGNMVARQVIRRSDGGRAVHKAVASVRYVRSASHRHWHVIRFTRYDLRRASDGRNVRPDQKTGFCLGDRYDTDAFEDWGGEPARGVYQSACGMGRPGLLRLREGISVGYGDEYGPHLEGQYVDVTGIPAGKYDLVHTVNGGGRLLEQRYDNNASCLGLRVTWPRGKRSRPSIRATTCHNDPNEGTKTR